jgi:hypothetical protein
MKTEQDQSNNNNNPGNNPNSNIGRKLREEALADSPNFSPLLHARIMRQIQPRATAAPLRSPWRIGWTLPTSAAAVALLALTVWIHNHQPTNPKIATTKSPSIPQLAIQFPNLSEQANSSLSQARYGYLDRDAKAAADYVINQFDIIPTAPARRG